MNRKTTALFTLLALLAAAIWVTASAAEKARGPKEVFHVQTSTRDVRSPLDETYNSTDTPLAIPDGPGGEVASSIVITDSYVISDIDVRVNITHTYTSDLQLYLRRTTGLEVRLFNHRGGSGDNITNCVFDDEAAQSISVGQAPFTGSWRPEQPLSVFDAGNIEGTWQLRVLDDAGQDVGTLNSWSMIVTEAGGNAGDIFGVVTDVSNGELLQFAKVSVVGLPGQQCTPDDGTYLFTLIPAGEHQVQFRHEYYQPFNATANVPAGGFFVLDAALTPYPDFESESFQSTGAAVPINDLDTSFKSLVVSGDLISSDIDVTININHTYIGDLDIWVENPSGARAQLTAHNGGNNGMNYTNCRLDDEACVSVAEAEAPYTGRFSPVGSLESVEGEQIQGTWRLVVYDFFDQDEGQIVNWSVHATHFTIVSADDPRPDVPLLFSFDGNFPNPFNASTEFRYSLDREADVSLKLYNVSGQEAARVYSGRVQAGSHSIYFDASSLSTGIYFASLSANSQSKTHKIVLLK